MPTKLKSRWVEDQDESAEAIALRKVEKEQRRKAKEERLRKAAEQEPEPRLTPSGRDHAINGSVGRPTKRRRTSTDPDPPNTHNEPEESKILAFPVSRFARCRDVEEYEFLNNIEEGSYGMVSRARTRATGEIVALKRLKMDHAADGFPVTGLREIQALMASHHENIVQLLEVVTSTGLKDVYLVMEFHPHDLKTLLSDMSEPFLPSEIKTLMQQLLSATVYLHTHWILHRDLKTSNLLLNNHGQLRLADFGMARYTSQPPPPNLTQLCVTLWYRAPELLLGTTTYSFDIDMWSIGCIFAELLTCDPLFQGKNEVDQLSKIFSFLGPPTRDSWPGFHSLPNAKALHPLLSTTNSTRTRLPATHFPQLTTAGLSLLAALLSLNPVSRPTAASALTHAYFHEEPRPKPRAMFPTFPSKAGLERRRKKDSPLAPARGEAPRMGAEDFASVFGEGERGAGDEGIKGAGFSLRLG